jgi:hypothetical protein
MTSVTNLPKNLNGIIHSGTLDRARMLTFVYYFVAVCLLSGASSVDALLQIAASTTGSIRSTTALSNSFFKDVLGAAFQNDANLSRNNKRAGMLDEGLEEEKKSGRQLTSTQQAWRQTMLSTTVSKSEIEGIAITLDMFLTGVPSKDPSNDLYGSKTNISLRDRVVGQVLPSEPTVSGVTVSFLDTQKCAVQVLQDGDPDGGDNGFCKTEQLGDWKLSDDNRQIRFRLAVSGYKRTVQTKGTIQKIYWSSQDETTTQTSTTYSIPEGWLYFEADLSVSKTPGKPVQWSEGVVKVEQPMGLLGAASRMIPCGKFVARSST